MPLTTMIQAILTEARKTMPLAQYLEALNGIGQLCHAEHQDAFEWDQEPDCEPAACLCDCCQLGEPVPF